MSLTQPRSQGLFQPQMSEPGNEVELNWDQWGKTGVRWSMDTCHRKHLKYIRFSATSIHKKCNSKSWENHSYEKFYDQGLSVLQLKKNFQKQTFRNSLFSVRVKNERKN